MAASRPKAYRPYRAAVYVTYIVVVGFLIALPFVSVLRGLIAHAKIEPPPRAALVTSPPGAPLSEEEARACLEAFERLRVDIRSRFSGLVDLAAGEGREAMRTWADDFRIWEATRASVAAECKLEEPTGGPPAEAVLPVAASLERVGRAYNSHATRLVIEDGPAFEDLAESLGEARRRLAP